MVSGTDGGFDRIHVDAQVFGDAAFGLGDGHVG
jgi:hypothetical protein